MASAQVTAFSMRMEPQSDGQAWPLHQAMSSPYHQQRWLFIAPVQSKLPRAFLTVSLSRSSTTQSKLVSAASPHCSATPYALSTSIRSMAETVPSLLTSANSSHLGRTFRGDQGHLMLMVSHCITIRGD